MLPVSYLFLRQSFWVNKDRKRSGQVILGVGVDYPSSYREPLDLVLIKIQLPSRRHAGTSKISLLMPWIFWKLTDVLASFFILMAVGPAFVSREAPKVNMIENVADFSASNFAATSNVVASNVSDYGGYLFPVFGLIALAGLILFLSPPLVDE
jgi:hypothetical protein